MAWRWRSGKSRHHASMSTDCSADAHHIVTLLPQGWQFVCASEQTVLLAALQAGLAMPHSCRNGSCRACMSRLIAGEIRYRIEWPGLLREEKAEGWILPCVAEPRSALTIEPPHAWLQAPTATSPESVDKSVHSLPTAPASD
jgi:ferredoxin